jgi:hypothetical protein
VPSGITNPQQSSVDGASFEYPSREGWIDRHLLDEKNVDLFLEYASDWAIDKF